jgi:invasion protein IalB
MHAEFHMLRIAFGACSVQVNSPTSMRYQRENEERTLYKIVKTAFSALILGSGSTSLLAQVAPQQPQAQSAHKVPDPNELVCEKTEDTGSRLSSHRICKTRAEWAEEKLSQRMDLDKLQTQRGCTKNGC